MTLFEFDKAIDPLGALEIHRELRAWDAISLPEMDGVAFMERVDTKYLLDEGCLLALLRRVQPEYRILEIDGDRVFRYETLDFDTPQRQCYLQHHNGKLNRQKYRIRKYRDSGRCLLEIKARSSRDVQTNAGWQSRRLTRPCLPRPRDPWKTAFNLL